MNEPRALLVSGAFATPLRSDVGTSLAAQVRDGLKTLDPYFEKLADGMLAWVDAWRMLNNKLV